MTIGYNPSILTSNLQLCLDAGNPRSYIGSGTTWNDVSPFASIYGASNYTYPSIGGSNLAKYFTFINNGSTSNNIYSSVNNISTFSQTQYTRIGWFYSTGSVEWAPIIQNSIGNNSDMGLAVSGNTLMFRQYNNNENVLQALTMYNLSSPIISILTPIIMLIIPFFLITFLKVLFYS